MRVLLSLLLWGTAVPAGEVAPEAVRAGCREFLAVVAKGTGSPWEWHVARTKQTPLDTLPEVVRKQVRKVIEATDENGWEHAVVVLQVGDRFLVARGVVTSRSDRHVNAEDLWPSLLSLARQAEALPPEARSQPVTIHHFHSHPNRVSAGALVRRPIERDSKGNAYTLVSVPEDYRAQDAIRDALAKDLRFSGFTGPITGAAGPVPACIEENANPYVALHRSDADPSAAPAFARFAPAGDAQRIPVTVGAAPFALDGGKVRVPGKPTETVGTLSRRLSGWFFLPNVLSETPVRVDGREVPATGMAVGPDSVVTVKGHAFHLR